MVTTRRQSGGNSDSASNVSPALESSPHDIHAVSSKKRRRTQVEDISSTHAARYDSSLASTRKRQKLPVREKDEIHFERHTHIAVEIPVRDITHDDTPMWTAPKQRNAKGRRALAKNTLSSPEVHEEDDLALSSVAQESVDNVSLVDEMSGNAVREREQVKKAGSKQKRKIKSSPATANAAIGSNPAKPKHKRFGSEEPAAEEFNLVGKEDIKVEEDDQSSEDDAPEVVATHDAHEKATITARNAAKAAEEQHAVIRKKRKDRDVRLKEQAKAAKQNRRHADDGDEGHIVSTSPDGPENTEEHESREELPGNATDTAKNNPALAKARTIINKNNIPKFLPAEYLEDDLIDNLDSLQSINMTIVPKPKKIKFTDAPKKPKDRRIGSTTYHVAEAPGDSSLAPKAESNARSIKEAWLNGQRGPGGSRKAVKGGFFKKRR